MNYICSATISKDMKEAYLGGNSPGCIAASESGLELGGIPISPCGMGGNWSPGIGPRGPPPENHLSEN